MSSDTPKRGFHPTAAAHRQAYELWKEHRKTYTVANKMGLNYRTIRAWKGSEYKCRYGCQWHGWTELLATEQSIISEKVSKLFDASHEMMDPSNAASNISFERDVEIRVHQHRLCIAEMIRSDVERLTHFELLYGMIFYRITGIKLETGVISDVHGTNTTLEELYNKIPAFDSLDKGLNSLSKIMGMIDQIRVRAGLVTGTGAAKSQGEVQKEEEAAQSQRPDELTLEELRTFKSLVENTPPEKRAALKAMLQSETLAVNASSVQ